MADRDERYELALVLEEADETVVTDSVAPKASQLTVKGLAEPAWVVTADDPGFQELDDAAANRLVQPIELADRVPFELNRPDPVRALPPPGSASARASQASRPREDSRPDPP